MRRLLSLLVPALLVGAGLLGTAPPASAAAVRIMVVGDSISQGSAGDFTWRYRLYKHLVASGAQPEMVGSRTDLFDNVRNVQGDQRYADPAFDRDHEAVWGKPAAQMRSEIGAKVTAASPDVVLVLLGINDLVWGFGDAAATAESLRTLVTNARAARPGVTVVLGRVTPAAITADPAALAAQVADLNTRIGALATALDTPGQRVVTAATDSGFSAANDTYDGVHPNARGELRIAAAFADALASTVGIGATYPRPLPTVEVGPRVAPTLSVTNGNASARLSWTESPGATGYHVWMRSVTEGQAWTRLPIPLGYANSPWTAGLLQNGGTYEFRLQAAKGEDLGVFSNTVTARPSVPTPGPATLSVTNGAGQARLSWTAGSNATAYSVWMRNVTEGQAFTKLQFPVTSSPWTAGLLTNGGTYEFRLQSLNGSQVGSLSNTVTARPSVPTPGPASLSVTSGNGQARLSWTGGSNATAYSVWMRNVTEGQAFTKLPIPIWESPWTAGLLTNGGTYEFRLQSLNGYQVGSYSNTVTARPSVPTPGAATLSVSNGDGEARLSWSPGSNATSYSVWMRNVTAGQAFTELPIPITSSPWTAGLLQNGATYEFKLRSRNGYQVGAYSNTVTAKPLGPYPAAPTITSAVSGNGQVALTWSASAHATGYYVYWREVGGFDQLNPWGSLASYTRSQYPVTGTTWTVPFLANGRQYQFYVQPVNGLQSRTCSIGSTNGCSFPAFGYPEPPDLSITRQAQQDPNWCCTATARAALGFYGTPPAQSTLANEIGLLEPLAYGFADPRKVASSLTNRGHRYVAQSGVGGATLQNIVLNAVNFRQGPVIIVAQTNKIPWYSSSANPNLAHCLVIYGYDNHSITGSVNYRVWDPSSGSGGGNHVIADSDWDRMGYDPLGFFGGIGHWVVSPNP